MCRNNQKEPGKNRHILHFFKVTKVPAKGAIMAPILEKVEHIPIPTFLERREIRKLHPLKKNTWVSKTYLNVKLMV